MSVTFKKYHTQKVSFCILSTGLFLMVLGYFIEDISIRKLDISSLLINLGAYISVIICLQFLYDSWVKEQYQKDIFEAILGAGNVKNSGIKNFIPDSTKFNYEDLIKNSKEIDIFVHTSSRLIKDYIESWEHRVKLRKKANIYYMKINGKAAKYMDGDYNIADIESNLNQLKEDYLLQVDPDKKYIKSYEHDFILSYNIFKFDKTIIIVLKTTTKHKASVPLFFLTEKSNLYKFVHKDMKNIMERIKNGR